MADEICTLHLLGQRPDEDMRIMPLLRQRIGPRGRPREQIRTVVKSSVESFTGAALSNSLCAALWLCSCCTVRMYDMSTCDLDEHLSILLSSYSALDEYCDNLPLFGQISRPDETI